ncbi:hypothetical protein K1720_10220 [Thermococcus argininiproducens]|uniref:Uncharacterized protein n=1 Tax=Thermococcus argininiproducens TaxID=2866384 RepID=A0A9E7SCD4_9EURY|nr:hypothetical protein [Thermococcus argininiproducens]USG99843.1 hypothetical protein K1720_10220 [Thermococcus argininiproducens]
MKIEIKLNFLPWNEFRFEYKFSEKTPKSKPKSINEPRVCLNPPIEVSLEPTTQVVIHQ